MSKRKKPSLLDGIASMDAVAPKCPQSWHGQIKATDPEAYRDLIEVVMDFHAGGVSYKKLRTRSALMRCLREQGAVPKISQTSFDNFLNKVRDDGQEAT